MRVDTAGAKTWLLGAGAAWALVAWALGLFGLGSRIESLPDDPSLVQRLPAVPPSVDERLGPLPQYAEIGGRPLFTDDRRPQAFFINPEGEGEVGDTFDFVLTSVLITPRLEMAIVRPADGGEPLRLRVGDAPEGAPAWRLASLSPRSVVFSGPEGDRTLELRVFDGEGGEPPTAMTAAQGPGSGVAAGVRAGAGSLQPPRRQPAAANPPIAVTTSSAPAPVPVSVPDLVAPPAEIPINPRIEAVQTPDAQVEAIRQRIEARRAQMRQQSQQAQQAPPPAPDENP